MAFDLVLRGGRVVDPSQKLDAITDVAFADGKVAAVGNALKVDPGTDVRDVSGYIVTPGLIDLHTHVYWGGTSLGIDAEEFCRTSGVTTAIDNRQRRSGQLRRLPQARDRAESGPHSGLSARLACRHLWLFASVMGRRKRGNPPDESDRRRSGCQTPTAISSSASRCGSAAPRRAPPASCHSRSPWKWRTRSACH